MKVFQGKAGKLVHIAELTNFEETDAAILEGEPAELFSRSEVAILLRPEIDYLDWYERMRLKEKRLRSAQSDA